MSNSNLSVENRILPALSEEIISALPDEVMQALTAWYTENAEAYPWRRDTEPYHVWLSEIMLQQTRAETVIPYYKRFLKELPTIHALAEVDEDKLMKLWEGLGYYSRARNLQRAAQVVMQEHDGVFPDDPALIRNLPGIGSYTTGAIASICFDLPTPAVDGNVLRVVARLLCLRASITDPKTKKEIEGILAHAYPPARSGKCGAFTQGLMELGQTICVPNKAPDCATCPLRDFCVAHAQDIALELPVRAAKKAQRDEDITVFILVSDDGKVAIRRRPKNGLLGGMWEFPNAEKRMSKAAVRKLAESWKLTPDSIADAGRHTHVFTHIKWHMQGYLISCEQVQDSVPSGVLDNQSKDFILCERAKSSLSWVTPDELADTYALPSAFKKFIPALRGLHDHMGGIPNEA